MSALDTAIKIFNTKLVSANLKYCFVDYKKHPFTISNKPCRVNEINDFVDFQTICSHKDISLYAGLGISIQASNICAIDIDHCFSREFDIESIDDRGKTAIEMFKSFAYIEFSFSGTGMRILFRLPIIEDYTSKYYIKNDKTSIEYYQPEKSYRYVTVTGITIVNNNVNCSRENFHILIEFLDKYMIRNVLHKSRIISTSKEIETRSIDELMKVVRKLYLTNFSFQENWFNKAPGSGSNESQRDFYLLSFLYENVTRDKDMIKEIFESSPFYKSKDAHHIYKWKADNFRYFNYVYNRIKEEN